MHVSEMLLPEFDTEMKSTRKMLERVPEDKNDYKPHEKSMALGRLAGHVAQLPEFAINILELPSLDFSKSDMKPLVLESRQQLLEAFDGRVQRARAALEKTSDKDWEHKWSLSFQGQKIAEDSRLQIYRAMFLNHLVHHRAQLGVYYRLNGIPLPAIYGPSADDTMGF